MGIFGGNKEKGKLVLVFDIGSSSVGGALFLMRDTGIPKIIFSVREPIILEENLNVNRFLALAIKSLKIVTSRIYSAKLGAPKEIFCVLSSPWYVSQTRIIKLEKNAPFIFNSKLADSLIQKEIVLFEEDNLAEYVKTKNPIRLIEIKNIKIMLNGYETSIPLNQKVQELEMTIFISMSPEQVLGKIEKTIQELFHFREIKFSSSVMTSFAVVRDMNTHNENFLLINIGGEVTNISMVKKNILRESISFPLGFNFLIRGVASFLSCSLSEAKSYLSLLKNEHASASLAKKLEVILGKLKLEWLTKFQASLANLSNDISIPATIYIAVDRDLANFFSEVIKSEQFNQYTLAESKFKVIFLSVEVLHGLAEFEENIIRDAFLLLDSIYINRFLNKI